MQEPINRRNKTIRMLQSKKMFDYTYKKNVFDCVTCGAHCQSRWFLGPTASVLC